MLPSTNLHNRHEIHASSRSLVILLLLVVLCWLLIVLPVSCTSSFSYMTLEKN